MTAKQIIEGNAPTIAPPKPGTKPDKTTAPTKPRKHPNPFRRREIKPGEEPAPKAHSYGGYPYESDVRPGSAKALILGETFASLRHQAPGRTGLKMDRARDTMNQIRARFKDERSRGYKGRSGTDYPPLPPEAVDAAWQEVEPKYGRVIYAPDPELARKLDLTYQHDPGPAGPDAPAEPGICPHCHQPLPE